MSSNEVVAGMEFYAGEVKRQDTGSQKVNPIVAWLMIALTLVCTSAILYGVGKLFFWDKYNADPFYEQQYQALKQRVQADPENVENLVALGWIYFQKSDYNQALVYFDRATGIDEKHFPAMFNKGLTYLEIEKYSLAINAFQNAVQLAPRDHVTHMNLGLAYTGNEEFEKAIDSLTKAYMLKPGTTEILIKLGQVHERVGKTEDAVGNYREVLSYDPKNETAQAALKRLGQN